MSYAPAVVSKFKKGLIRPTEKIQCFSGLQYRQNGVGCGAWPDGGRGGDAGRRQQLGSRFHLQRRAFRAVGSVSDSGKWHAGRGQNRATTRPRDRECHYHLKVKTGNRPRKRIAQSGTHLKNALQKLAVIQKVTLSSLTNTAVSL